MSDKTSKNLFRLIGNLTSPAGLTLLLTAFY